MNGMLNTRPKIAAAAVAAVVILLGVPIAA